MRGFNQDNCGGRCFKPEEASETFANDLSQTQLPSNPFPKGESLPLNLNANDKLTQVKRLMLEEPENKCTEEGVEKVVSRIERSFGQMKVKMATDI